MTIAEAIEQVQTVGSVRAENGKLKLRFPELERGRLKPAIETLRENRDTALAALTAKESGAVPPAEAWPQSLDELAQERGKQTGDIVTARKEIWISYEEFLACQLNRLFDELGTPGPGQTRSKITAATVRHGMERATRRLEGRR
ncbi:MAG TPA: hypothetical protein VIY49_17165 [Bryobacteraceae bacterium]